MVDGSRREGADESTRRLEPGIHFLHMYEGGSNLSWITPKTDWSETDKISFEDMNRIENNEQYLQNLNYFTVAKKFEGALGRSHLTRFIFDLSEEAQGATLISVGGHIAQNWPFVCFFSGNSYLRFPNISPLHEDPGTTDNFIEWFVRDNTKENIYEVEIRFRWVKAGWSFIEEGTNYTGVAVFYFCRDLNS